MIKEQAAYVFQLISIRDSKNILAMKPVKIPAINVRTISELNAYIKVCILEFTSIKDIVYSRSTLEKTYNTKLFIFGYKKQYIPTTINE